MVRIFLNLTSGIFASIEAGQAPHFRPFLLAGDTTMKPSPSLLSRLITRLLRALQSLLTSPPAWRPGPAPVLEPIPIRIEHAPPAAARQRRHPGR
jgi:hypothetical protein